MHLPLSSEPNPVVLTMYLANDFPTNLKLSARQTNRVDPLVSHSCQLSIVPLGDAEPN